MDGWMDGWMAHGGNRKILKRRSELIRAASEKSVPEIHCLRLGLFKLIHIILYRFPMVLVPSGYVNSSLFKKWPSRNVVDLPIDSMVDLSSSLCKRLPFRVYPSISQSYPSLLSHHAISEVWKDPAVT